jgi:hypothetical protein
VLEAEDEDTGATAGSIIGALPDVAETNELFEIFEFIEEVLDLLGLVITEEVPDLALSNNVFEFEL